MNQRKRKRKPRRRKTSTVSPAGRTEHERGTDTRRDMRPASRTVVSRGARLLAVFSLASAKRFLLFLVPVLAACFAAAQAYLAYEQRKAAMAEARQETERKVAEAREVLVAASGDTLPLLQAARLSVKAARENLLTRLDAGAVHEGIEVLVSFSDILLFKFSAAEDRLLEAKHQDPSTFVAYLALGVGYFSQGNYEASEAVLAEGLRHFPDSALLRSHQARALLRLERYEAAYEAAARATSNSQDARAYLALGLVLLRMEAYGDARDAFSLAHQTAPNWHEPLFALGAVSAETGQLRAALVYFEKAVRLAPDDTSANLARAAVLHRLGLTEGIPQIMAEIRGLLPIEWVRNSDGASIWETDYWFLDEFCGEFLLIYAEENPEWKLVDFHLPLMRALGGASTTKAFYRFEDALLGICVVPLYWPRDTDFIAAQQSRFIEMQPDCIFDGGLNVILIGGKRLRLPLEEIGKRPAVPIDSERFNAFLAEHDQEARKQELLMQWRGMLPERE